MKKIGLFTFVLCLSLSLFSYEIYNGNIYPGAINHWNTSYGYGTFNLNTMESQFSSVTIDRTLTFNNSLTTFEYSYNSDGLLTAFNESFQINDGEVKNTGAYSYEYKEGELTGVKLNEQDIYFPSPYFLMIRDHGDELVFDYEFNNEGKVISFLLNDKNGTKYFLKNRFLKSIESIGLSENRLSSSYEYDENQNLRSYSLEYEEGKGLSRKRTRSEFVYDDDNYIEKYLLEKSGQGQIYSRVRCSFEHITNEDETIDTTFALNDDGEIVRTAVFEYETRNNYSVKIYDEKKQLMVTYVVEQN